MEMFALPITPVPDKVYHTNFLMTCKDRDMSFGQLMCSGYVTHDCSDKAAGLDIKGAAYSTSLAHKQVYIQRTFCTSFPNFDFS
jgi:hypothetical protein